MSLTEDAESGPKTATGKRKLNELGELLKRSKIDVDDIARVERVNVWQGFIKNAADEVETVDLHSISLVPKWADGPQWPVIQPGPAVKVKRTARKPVAKPAGFETAVILPDIQLGFYHSKGGGYEPTHDESALSVALDVIRAAQPDQVVMVGDNLDLPELSRYRHSPAWVQTTQPSIDRATELCAELRSAAPEARIVWIAGNHEERLPNFIKDNAVAAFGLRKGGSPDSWPVLSVPYLCRFDDFDVTYLPGYPASRYWLNDRLQVVHGDLVTAGGSTAHKYLTREKVSTIYGHVHRREWAERTREDFDGPRTVMAASPGCLARIDGAVPSTKQGEDLDGRPLRRSEDWQQGLGVVTYEPGRTGSARYFYEQVQIFSGAALWRGQAFGTLSTDQEG